MATQDVFACVLMEIGVNRADKQKRSAHAVAKSSAQSAKLNANANYSPMSEWL